MKQKLPLIFHYRGMIERGPRYEWKEGYSENSADGLPLYPWITRGEARSEAHARGYQAVFYRDGKSEATNGNR